jgi:hypothetical protein
MRCLPQKLILGTPISGVGSLPVTGELFPFGQFSWWIVMPSRASVPDNPGVPVPLHQAAIHLITLTVFRSAPGRAGQCL